MPLDVHQPVLLFAVRPLPAQVLEFTQEHKSRVSLAVPVKDTTASSTIKVLKSLQARLGAIKLQRIQFDGAFRNEELIAFCHNTSPRIDIRFSPPYEHESQVAESLVNAAKSLGRALLHDGGGSEDFRALAYK